MDVLGRINTLLWALIRSLRSVKEISIFLPYFFFAILQAIILASLVLFYIPPFSQLLVPLMVRFFGEPALHYPHSFAVLPTLFFQTNRLLNLCISWLIIGTATVMFATHYRHQPIRIAASFGRALRRIVPLFVVGAVEWLLVDRVLWLIELLVRDSLHWGVQSPGLYSVFNFLLGLMLITPFAFTSAIIVLGERGVWGALKGSFSLARRNFGVTFLIFAIPSFFTLLMNRAMGKAPEIVFGFSPELVLILLGLSLVITLVVNFVIVGALTALYLMQTETAR